jgi:hypothetical protein
MVSCNGLSDGLDMSDVFEIAININFGVELTHSCMVSHQSRNFSPLIAHLFLPRPKHFTSGIKDVCRPGGSQQARFVPSNQHYEDDEVDE